MSMTMKRPVRLKSECPQPCPTRNAPAPLGGRRRVAFFFLACAIVSASLHAGVAEAPKASAKPAAAVLPGHDAFDVASIKPSDPGFTGFSIRPRAENFTVNGATLKFLIQYAYDVHDFQVQGGPSWIGSAKFDVRGKMDGTAAHKTADRDEEQEVLQRRLKALLAERFHLVVHTEKKEEPVYALRLAKGGPRLQPSEKNEGYRMARGMLECSYSSMDNLAEMLSDSVNRIVIDRTGLEGIYAFKLKWTPDDSEITDAGTPGLLTAIQEQVGLKLNAEKGSVPVVIVHSATRPTAN